MSSHFVNRSWVESWGREWVDNGVEGFFDIVPPGRFPLQQYHRDDDANGVPNCPLGPKSPACTGGVDFDFTIVPDGAWYTIKPFFMHKVSDIATKLLLAHLKRYNMFHGFPVAPEVIH